MEDLPIILLIVIFAGVLGMIFGCINTQSRFERQAVLHGAAHYNATNRNFEWNK